jgi:radical SAM protein with 4Fe4S-binding SPASM domain
MKEVFSEENLNAVIDAPDQETGLLRQGKLLSIMKDGSHPYEAAQRARHTLAAVALAVTSSPVEATYKFQRLGLVTDLQRTEIGMRALCQNSTAAFQKWDQQMVSLDQQCQNCPLRYLCVEVYRTWNRQSEQNALDAPPGDGISRCQRAHLLRRARWSIRAYPQSSG